MDLNPERHSEGAQRLKNPLYEQIKRICTRLLCSQWSPAFADARHTPLFTELSVRLICHRQRSPSAPLFTIVNARNIDENKKYEDKLKFLSQYGQLTGAANRAFFNQEMKNPERMIYPVSVMVCDFDGLKSVNDRYGHAAGDRIIIATSNLIKSALRKEDLLTRMGGDEFAVCRKALRGNKR